MMLLRTICVLGLLGWLAGCGGGGSGNTPNLRSATCDSTTLWAASPATNGSTIPDNNTTGISVTWDNQNCSLQSVSSAMLEICLSHTQPTDLLWTIKPPNSGTALNVTAPVNWNTTGSSCDSGQGKFQRIDLLPTVQNTVVTQGLWTLNVSDRISGDTGTLIQWRVIVQGLN